jgi:fluoride exporter
MSFIMIGAGGFLGAVARYAIYLGMKGETEGGFPLPTLVVNALGCLGIGFIMALEQKGTSFSPTMISLISVGFLGAFTTFSAFGYETLELIKYHQHHTAVFNVVAQVAVSLGAVILGRFIAQSV